MNLVFLCGIGARAVCSAAFKVPMSTALIYNSGDLLALIIFDKIQKSIPQKKLRIISFNTRLVVSHSMASFISLIVTKKLGYPIRNSIAIGCSLAAFAAGYTCFRMQKSAHGRA
ncbi:MAG TPA: hypothetical protein VHA52_13660 [Candidatus Babeliaceae bacterium]|nr:hypothetical protein [Candidatus Babeliaceae bacterium]